MTELAPRDLDEACRMIAAAAAAGERLSPLGGGSRSWLGRPGLAGAVPVRTSGLNRIVHYEPDDLTIGVEAGIGFSELQRTLDAEGQWLPLNPPNAQRSTIGGLLATGACGSLRFRYGAWRDLVLGMTVVLASGEAASSGGRVVKNVAGFDLHKLHIGALGTLALIARVNLRLQPLPPDRQVVMASFESLESAVAAAQAIASSQLEAVAVEVHHRLDPAPGYEGGTWLAVRLAGLTADCDRAAAQMVEDLARPCEVSRGDEARAFWAVFDDSPLAGDFVCRVTAPPTVAAALLASGRLPPRTRAWADIATGVVHVLWGVGSSEADVLQGLEALRREVAGAGCVTLHKAPESTRARADVWGKPPPAYPLMLAVKRALDPTGVWNPGRYIGEL